MEHGCVPCSGCSQAWCSCIWNAFGHPPGNRDGEGALSEMRADCFFLYLESYSRHWVTDAPSKRKKHPSRTFEAVGGICCFLGSVGECDYLNHFFLYFSAIFLLGHFVTMIKWPKVSVLCFFGETGPCPLQCLVLRPRYSCIDEFQMWKQSNAPWFRKLLMCWHATNRSVFAREEEYIHR